MSSTAAHKRQMKLLRQIAKKAQYRTDTMVSLERDYPAANRKRLRVTEVLIAHESQLAYDFDTLCRGDLLEYTTDRWEQDRTGAVIVLSHGVHITAAGLEAVRQMERSKIAKMIERQPITALNVAASTFTALWVSAGAWLEANGYPAWLLHWSAPRKLIQML